MLKRKSVPGPLISTRFVFSIIDWSAAQKYGAKTDGSAAGSSPEVLADLVGMIDRGELEVPIAKTYPLDQVREAYRELEQRHTGGKIVLTVGGV